MGRRAGRRHRPPSADHADARLDRTDLTCHARYDTHGDVAEIVISNPPLNLWGPQLISDVEAASRAPPPSGRAP